jgi:hypothetical protein
VGGLRKAIVTTPVQCINNTTYLGDNKVFFYVVDPLDNTVESDGFFIANDRYRPIAHLDRGDTSSRFPISSAPGDVYATLDDTAFVPVSNYKVVDRAYHEFPPKYQARVLHTNHARRSSPDPR